MSPAHGEEPIVLSTPVWFCPCGVFTGGRGGVPLSIIGSPHGFTLERVDAISTMLWKCWRERSSVVVISRPLPVQGLCLSPCPVR